MSHEVVNRVRENYGSVHAEVVTIDITTDGDFTGLSDAGYEDVSASELASNLTRVVRASVVSHEDSGHRIAYDHTNGRIEVDALSDGSDVGSGTDVGEVVVEMVGE